MNSKTDDFYKPTLQLFVNYPRVLEINIGYILIV